MATSNGLRAEQSRGSTSKRRAEYGRFRPYSVLPFGFERGFAAFENALDIRQTHLAFFAELDVHLQFFNGARAAFVDDALQFAERNAKANAMRDH